MIEIGKLDRITSVIGERGTGKSYFAKWDAREFQRETGGFVVGHSPNGQIGADDDIAFHDDLKSLSKGIRRFPEMMHFLVSEKSGSAESTIDFADDLALALRKQAHERAGVRFNERRPSPSGLAAPPVLVVIDEGTHLKQKPERKSAGRKDEHRTQDLEELEKFLTSARHKHVALTWLIQAPTRRSWVFQEQSNRFRVFRYMHEWGLNAIRAAAVPQKYLEDIRTLPKQWFFLFDKDNPQGARFTTISE